MGMSGVRHNGGPVLLKYHLRAGADTKAKAIASAHVGTKRISIFQLP